MAARPRGHRPVRRVSLRVRADARSRARVDVSARPRHVGAGAGPRPRGPAPARTHLRVRVDAVFTASVGKCGRPQTSGRKGRPDGHFHPKTSFMTSLRGRPPRTAAALRQRTASAEARRTSALAIPARPLPRAADGQGRGRTGLAVCRLGGERFRSGGGRPTQGVVRLTRPHFHLPLTTSDVLQLLLALVAPMWWRVGVLFVITYTRFPCLHCGAQS
jgi:hypothetical protein